MINRESRTFLRNQRVHKFKYFSFVKKFEDHLLKSKIEAFSSAGRIGEKRNADEQLHCPHTDAYAS
jgi:hypothetical protein